ncbi:twin-arginine translocase subunit TatC [Heyndrickxia acidiproducens]|uniref:twin-arginine translocase subunit TatC n=1 Tax=Heyndrickxia acidiproducens TaxID=1121084 RepID=UPI00036724FA|nr:twin-arginine translocase subunit TatC [Heyndrickxia acidiproducens]
MMPLIGHLEELRKRIIIVVATFLAFFIIAMFNVERIYSWLLRDYSGQLAVLSPGDIVWIYCTISGIAAIGFTIPIAAFQTWRFVKPALTKEEYHKAVLFIPSLFFFFTGGIAFGYFLVYPAVFHFLVSLTGNQFELLFTSANYLKFLLKLTIPFGFLFEFPLAIMFLTSIHIVTTKQLKQKRKVFYFVLITASILLTPPDFISDLLVSVVMLLLYELGVLLSGYSIKKQQKRFIYENTHTSI